MICSRILAEMSLDTLIFLMKRPKGIAMRSQIETRVYRHLYERGLVENEPYEVVIDYTIPEVGITKKGRAHYSAIVKCFEKEALSGKGKFVILNKKMFD